MTVGHDPFEDLQRQTPAQLVAAIEVYGFRDPLGHPLHKCAEFQELSRRAAEAGPARTFAVPSLIPPQTGPRSATTS